VRVPLFSIVIPTHNRAKILAKTLECLERQTANFSYEVIVVDDCSMIPLPDFGFGKRKMVNWKLLRNETNLGRAATRNRGIRESRGEYILMIDDDIWASPGLLQAHFEAQKRIGGGVVIGAVPPASDVSDTVWHKYLAKRYARIHKRLQAKNLHYGLFFTGNVSLPSHLLSQTGDFNEAFSEYSYEDTELGYRFQKAGAVFYYASDAVGYHLFNETLETICQKAYQLGRSASIFVRLHPAEARSIQYHSITMGPWRGKSFIKNIVRLLLMNRLFLKTLEYVLRVGSLLKTDTIVIEALPWLEFGLKAKGAMESS